MTNLFHGTNVIAAEVHQSVATSSDIVMGLSLDLLWQPRLRDFNAPLIAAVVPAAGTTVATLTQIEVRFDEDVLGVDAADLLVNAVPATNLIVLTPRNYRFQFSQPPLGPVNVTWRTDHGIVDRSANSNAFGGAGFGYLIGSVSSAAALAFATVTPIRRRGAGQRSRDGRGWVDDHLQPHDRRPRQFLDGRIGAPVSGRTDRDCQSLVPFRPGAEPGSRSDCPTSTIRWSTAPP